MASQVGSALIRIIADDVQAHKSFRRLQMDFATITKAARIATPIVAGVFAAATAGIGGAIAFTESYNNALNDVQTATGATKAETEAMGKSLQNIYKANYGADFQDIAQAMGTVGQNTQATGKDLEDLTKTALLLRDRMQIDVAESTATADIMMKQFGISGREAMNMIARGQQDGLNRNGDLLDSFSEYSVYFKQLGYDAEDMYSVMQAGISAGVRNTDLIGDAFKEFGIRAKDNSDLTRESFAALTLDADKMQQMIAKGGPTAQAAMQTTFQALAGVRDEVKRNELGVALFGTQFEDMEYKAISALGNVETSAGKGRDALKQIEALRFGSLSAAFQGVGRSLMVEIIDPMNKYVIPLFSRWASAVIEQIPVIVAAIRSIFNDDMMSRLSGWIDAAKFGFNEIKKFVIGLIPTFQNLIEIARNIWPIFEAVGIAIAAAFVGIMRVLPPVLEFITDIAAAVTRWEAFVPIVLGIIAAIVSYRAIMIALNTAHLVFRTTVLLVNGAIAAGRAAMIAYAVAGGGLRGVLAALRAGFALLNVTILANPFVLVAALIIGLAVALVTAYKRSETFRNVVNGVWKDVKDGFGGMIRWFTTTLPKFVSDVYAKFVEMRTKVVNSIIGFVSDSTARFNFFKAATVLLFVTMWNYITGLFGKAKTNIISTIGGLISGAEQRWNSFKTNTTRIFTNIKDGISDIFSDIVENAKALPGRVGNGIKAMAGGVANGVKTMANKLATGIGAGINGAIDGINWVLGKLEIPKIDKWEIPQYRSGTKNHPGGWAVLNDAAGSNYKEYYRTPDGQVGMFEGRNVMANLPPGTSVLDGRRSAKLMKGKMPFYKGGAGDFLKDMYEAAKGKVGKVMNGAGDLVKKGAAKAKDLALDIWDFIDKPGSLVDKAFSHFIPGMGLGGGTLGNIGVNALKMIKDKAVGFISDRMPVMDYNFGAPFHRTSSYGPRWGKLHKGIDWGAPTGTPYPAVAGGKVIRSEFGRPGSGFNGYGNYVLVQGAGGMSYLYGHNSRNRVKVGDQISRGQIIAEVGSTGQSTGPHVHFETRKNGIAIDPDSMGGMSGLSTKFTGSGAAAAKNWITQAMRITGTPMSFLPGLMKIAQKESGFNPNAVNLWDSNAKAGHPSEGLFQTIPTTFRAHMMKGMGNIRNPIHNAVAAIRYMNDRYGGIANVPGLKNLAKGMGYVGYEYGGFVKDKTLAWLSENNKPEAVVPLVGNRMDPFAVGVAQKLGALFGLNRDQQQPAAVTGPLVIQSILNGRVIAEETYSDIQDLQERQRAKNNRAKGRVNL